MMNPKTKAQKDESTKKNGLTQRRRERSRSNQRNWFYSVCSCSCHNQKRHEKAAARKPARDARRKQRRSDSEPYNQKILLSAYSACPVQIPAAAGVDFDVNWPAVASLAQAAVRIHGFGVGFGCCMLSTVSGFFLCCFRFRFLKLTCHAGF